MSDNQTLSRATELQLTTDGNWVANASRIISPNQDDRPIADDISLLVIHGISLPPGEFGGGYIDQLFTNTLDPSVHPYFSDIAHNRVSAHLLINREGDLCQYVAFGRRAWHAGSSSFRGRSECNDYSIGIELEGCDDQPYTDSQYRTLAEVTRVLTRQWPAITRENIVGHCDIAPDRKTDPGQSFDWGYYFKLLES